MTDSLKAIFNNSVVIIIARLLGMLSSFVIVPFILLKLGMVGYGVWESILAITAISTLMMTSTTHTLMWSMSASSSLNDTNQLARWMGIGFGMTLLQTVFFVILAVILMNGITDVFSIPMEYREQFKILLPTVIGITLIGGIHETVGALISSFQKTGLVVLYKSVGIIIGQIVCVIFLLLGFGLYSILYGLVVNTLLATIMMHYSLRSINTTVGYSIASLSRDELLISRNFFLLTLLGTVTLLFRNHMSKIIIARVSDMESVANYGLATRLSSLVFLTVTFIMAPTVTAVSKSNAVKDFDDIKSIYTGTSGIFAYVSSLITILLCVNAEGLYKLWLGFYNDQLILYTLILLLCQSIAVVLTAVGVSICTGLGRREIETYYIAINLIMNVIFLFVLVPFYGGTGAILASSISWALSSIVFLVHMHKNVDLPQKPSINSVKVLIIAIIITIIARFLFSGISNQYQNDIDTLFKMVTVSTIITVLYSGILYRFKLLPKTFSNIIDRIK